MRKIITTTFTTLDGVMQAPGGPQEDTSGGFEYGGWQLGGGFGDKMTGNTLNDFMTIPFELLLGKRTYEIFAAFWPTAEGAPHISTPFNSTRKYVVSHAPMECSWNNSSLITGDVATQIKELKEADGPDLWVWGSGNLIQTLLRYNLIDQMHIWTFPITLGTGKKLFADGTQPQNLKLTDSKISTKGVIIATYEPDGPVKIG